MRKYRIAVLVVLVVVGLTAAVVGGSAAQPKSETVSKELLPQALRDAGLPTNPQQILNRPFSFTFVTSTIAGEVWGVVQGIDFSTHSGLRLFVSLPIGSGTPGDETHSYRFLFYDAKLRQWHTYANGLRGTLKIY